MVSARKFDTLVDSRLELKNKGYIIYVTPVYDKIIFFNCS